MIKPGSFSKAIKKFIAAVSGSLAIRKGKRSQNTFNKYKTVYNHLSEFIRERYHREDMAFRELTSDFIREFDFFLRIDKECTHNTVWVYTMPVIALAELAIKKGLIRQDPFEDYEISMEETDRSYLLKEDVEKLMLLKPSKSKYELVKDLFIFSCFTGLSYIDIQKLKWSNIQSFFDAHGPPMRVGTKSEIVMLNLKPQNRK